MLLINCSEKADYSKIGNKIISENTNVIFDSLNIFDVDAKHDVELKGAINEDSSIFYNYNLTVIDSSFIKKLRIKRFNIKNVKDFKLTLPKSFVIDHRQYSIKNIEPPGKTIWIELFNFYIDEKNNEAFLMVKKGVKGGIGYKTDIYYFKKFKDKWKYIGKDVISIG